MKFKNIFLSALAFSSCLMGGTSCSDSFLDEKIYSNYDVNMDDVQAKLIGLHRIYGQFWGQNGDQAFLTAFQLGTDVAMKGSGGLNNYFLYGQLNSNDGTVSNIWQNLYKLIVNANQIIDSVGEEGDKEAIAEAKFFRAYAYNMLVTLYGGVPLIDKYEEPRTDYVRAAIEDVDRFIDSDLQYCMTNLPDMGAAKEESRANKDFARQLAGEAYLRMGLKYNDNAYYEKAEQALSAIIGNNKYQLVTERYGKYLTEGGDCFRDMFRQGNERRSQGNTEAIWTFEVENANEVAGGNFDVFPQHRRVWVPQYRNLPGMTNCDSLGGRGNGLIYLTNHVKYGVYEEGDVRNSNYNLRRKLWHNRPNWQDESYGVDINGFRVSRTVKDSKTGEVKPNPEMVREVVLKTGDPVIPAKEDSLTNFFVYSTKWGEYNPKDDFGFGMVKDWPVMRLGETYLLRAEARFRLGKYQEAAADINKLRDRAFSAYRSETGKADAGVVTAQEIQSGGIDFILDERIRELITEEQRRMTLMRTNTLADRLNKYTDKAENGAKVTSDRLVTGFDPDTHILLPIPLTEIQLNKDAKLEQNPGY